ncbi:MAG: YggS family pyridoxal phosphate-dependent enzyme [Candidatus Dormibacteria bacterium]
MSAAAPLEERLAWVRAEMAAAAGRSGRDADEISLLPVTKGQPETAVAAALALGLDDLGENYLQECRSKDLALLARGQARPRWHMLGHLQRNKVRRAVELFSVLETVDSLALARAISAGRADQGRLMILCEVDFTGLPGRGGYPPAQLAAELEELQELPGVLMRGLMTVASREEPERCFDACRTLRDHLAEQGGAELPVLSMGMSGDFREAIAAGSTQVRAGTLLFGPRL